MIEILLAHIVSKLGPGICGILLHLCGAPNLLGVFELHSSSLDGVVALKHARLHRPVPVPHKAKTAALASSDVLLHLQRERFDAKFDSKQIAATILKLWENGKMTI